MSRFVKFFTAAGKKGIGFMTGGVLAFALALTEHLRGSSVPALIFTILCFAALIAGCYVAWSDTDDNLEAERARLSKPEITGDIVSADIGIFGSGTEHGRTVETTCLILKLRITNRTNSAATFKSASLTVERDGVKYEADREVIRDGLFTPGREKIIDLLKKVTYNEPVRYGIASEGWLQFCVNGLEHSKGNIKADLTVTLIDEFGGKHVIVAKNLLIAR